MGSREVTQIARLAQQVSSAIKTVPAHSLIEVGTTAMETSVPELLQLLAELIPRQRSSRWEPAGLGTALSWACKWFCFFFFLGFSLVFDGVNSLPREMKA